MGELVRRTVDKIVSVKEQDPDKADEMSMAFGAALDIPSTAVGEAARYNSFHTFERSLRDGNSVNQALEEATHPVANTIDIETGDTVAAHRTISEISVGFWDAMGPHEDDEEPTPAIERALNGYAPDGGSWLEAKRIFEESIQQGLRVDIALDTALGTITEGAETHPEVAKDRFYAGIDPDYADKEHFGGRERGVRIGVGKKSIEIGVGRDVKTKRQRKLGLLAARHSQDRDSNQS